MFYIGITLEKEQFRVAVIQKQKNTFLLESVHSLPYGPDSVKLFYNLPVFHTGKPITLCSGLDEVFIRKLHLPLSNRSALLKALPFQLESLIPSTGEPPLICTQLKRLSKQMTSVTVFATTESRVQTHVDKLREFDIKPDQVSCLPMALMRFAMWQLPQEGKIVCLDVRENTVTCVVVERGELLLSQTLCMKADPLVFEKLALFLKQKGILDETTPWVLTGEDPGVFFPGKKLEVASGEFAPALGLALDAAYADELSLQFCQKHLLAPHTLHKRKRQILTYASCCIGAACIMLACSSIWVAKKERLLAQELKPYLPSLSETASVQEIKEGLVAWESSLKGNKETFALVPNVPRVSDLLAYLSSHPALTTEEGARKEGIEIESIHYSLVKYPKINEPSTPYVAQVEVQLSSSTPRAARDFHEALLKGDSMVNNKKEIKWQTHQQSYLTSFELNKGVFP